MRKHLELEGCKYSILIKNGINQLDFPCLARMIFLKLFDVFTRTDSIIVYRKRLIAIDFVMLIDFWTDWPMNPCFKGLREDTVTKIYQSPCFNVIKNLLKLLICYQITDFVAFGNKILSDIKRFHKTKG